ncbi:hypothetical protein [Streptomyces sp. GbtcB6]|uniref:hypothetical protein n=1 Tax=Streptomyces sp. GbtcB6 TaxID=2824751 RepID=UPI001C2FB970|nr:hypothetical protein [Streptomyces sp. GbtcB6]
MTAASPYCSRTTPSSSILFYKAGTGRDAGQGVTGTLENGRCQGVRTYGNFSKGWGTMASSCDNLVSAAGQEPVGFPESGVGYGTLQDGVRRHTDSLFFYKDDGTARTSTLVGGDYANVGAPPDVSSGWTLFEGGG